MGSYSWNGGSGGWGTIANWSGGIPNSSTADATIVTSGTYTVTIESGKTYTVDSVTLNNGNAILDVVGTLDLAGTLGLIDVYSGTLELAGAISGGTVNINGGTLEALGGALKSVADFNLGGSAYINLDSHTLTIGGSSSLLGYITGPGEIVLGGQVSLSDNVYFESGVTLDDTGTINLGSSAEFGSGGTAATDLTIASGAIFDVTAINSALNDAGTFSISNAGLFENVEQTPTFTYGGDLDSYVNVYTNFTNAASGTIVVGTADDISLLQGQDTLAGTITGAGDIYLGQGSTVSLQAGLVLNNGRYLTISDGGTDVILESSRTFGSSFFELISGATLSLNGYTASLGSTGTLGGYLGGPGTVDVSGTYYVGGLAVGSGVTEVLTGVEIQNGESHFDYNGGTVGTALSIASTGIYDITADSNLDDYYGYNGTIANAGLFEKTGYSSYTNVYTNFINAGTGTIFIAAEDDISLGGMTNDLSGTLAGTGDFYLFDGQSKNFTTLEAGLSIGNLASFTVSDNNTQLFLESNRSFGSATVFTDQNSADIQLNGNTLTLGGVSQFINAYVSGNGELLISGSAAFNGLNVVGTMTVLDTGTITQDGYDELGTTGSAQVTLSIASHAIYDIIVDNQINPQNGAPIVNAGLFEKTAAGGVSDIYSVITNTSTGTIAAASGTMQFHSGGTLGGTLTGAGEISLDGGTFSLAAATIGVSNLYLYSELVLQNNVADTHEFVQESGTLALNGFTLSLGNPGDYLANSYLLGPGTLAESGRLDVNNYYLSGGAVLKDTGTITQDGGLTLGTFGADSATLSIASTGIYNILNDNAIGTDGATLSAINNAGLFEKTAATGGSNIYAVFDNAAGATLAVNAGYVQLLGGGTLGGALTGAGTLDLNQYYAAQTYTLAAAAVVTVATLDLGGGQLDLSNTHTFTDTFIESGGDLNLGGFNLTLSGAGGSLANAYLSGPGTLDVANAAQLNNYYVTGGATLLDAGTINEAGALSLGNTGSDSGTLSISSGGVYNFINDSIIYVNGTGVINNAGLFEKTADNGANYVYASINNTGIIDAARGTIQLGGGGTLGGTLEGTGEIELLNNKFVLTSAAVLGTATLSLASATLDIENGRTIAGTVLENYYSTIALDGYTLALTAADSVGGFIAGLGILDITGATDLGGIQVAGGATVVVAGADYEDSQISLGVFGTNSAGLLSIASGGTLALVNDDSIIENGAADTLVNAGLIEKTGSGTGRSNLEGANFTNTGTILIGTGILEISSLTNDGVVTIANAEGQVDSGVVANTGDTGKFLLGGNATLYDEAGIAASQTIVLSGTNDLVEIGNSGPFAATITGFGATDTIDVVNVVANGYSFGSNKLTLTENGTVVSTVAVSTVTGAGTFSLVQDSAGNGTDIELSKPGSITQPGGTITTDVFTASSGGDFNTASNWSTDNVPNGLNVAGIGINGTVTDSGTDTVYQINFNSGGLTFTQTAGILTAIDGGFFASALLQQGAAASLVDEAGDLNLRTNGTIAGTLGGTGEIDVGGNSGNGYAPISLAASAVLTVATLGVQLAVLEGNQTYNGVFEGINGGTLSLNGYTLTLNGATFLAPTYAYAVSGPGELILAGIATSAVLNVGGSATIDVTGIFSDDQNLGLGQGGGSDTSSMTIAATGTYDMLGSTNIYGDSYDTPTVAISGLLERTGDNGTANIQYVTIAETSGGILDAASGTLQLLYDSGTLAGTLAGNVIDLVASQLTVAAGAVLSVATLEIASGGTISVASNRTYAGNLEISGGGTLALGSFGLDLTGTAELGNEYVAGSGTLTVAGTADLSGMQLVGSERLLDASTIVQDGGLALGQYVGDTTSLLIGAGALYDIINDSNIGVNNGTGSIINDGLLEKTADNGISYIAPVFTNASTGTLDVVTGTIDLQGGGTLAGVVEGAGEVELQNNNGTFTLASGAVLSVATFNVNENLILESGRTYAGDLIQTNNLDLNGFNLSLTGTASLDSSVQGKGTLTVAKGDISGLYLYQDAAMVVKGTVTQDGGFTMGNTGTDNTALSIASGAVFDLLTDNSINANGTAAINNAGLFERTGDYGTSYIYAKFNNTGTLNAVRGFFDFEGGGSLSGTVEGGKDGTIADGGIVETGGTLTLASTATITVGEISLNGGDLLFGGNRTYAGSFSGTGGSLSLGGHTIGLTGPYLGGFYLTGPGTLDVSGTATLNGLGQISGAHLIDKGTIIQDGGYQLGYSTTDASQLSIASGATFDIVTDNYIGASGPAATVLNAGLFEKTAGNGYSGIQASFTNQSTGVINVSHGTLAVQGGGVLGGTLKGGGEIQIDSAATLTSTVVSVATLDIAANPTLGSNLTYAGDFILNYGDSLTLNAHALLLSGTAGLIGGFDGPGSVTVSGHAYVQTLDLFGGSTLVDSGFINQIDELRFGLYDGSSDTLSIAAKGTYDIQDDSNFHSYGNAGSAEVVINAGLLEKTGDTGLSDLQVTLSNTGTVLVDNGTLQIDANTNLAGGTLTGGTWASEAGLLGPTLSLVGGTLAVDAASVTLSGPGSEFIAGGTLIEQSLTSVAATGVLAVLGGRGYTAASAIADAGRIVLQSGTFAAPALNVAAGGTLSGYGTVTGPVTDNGLIDATSSTLTLTGSVGGAGSLLIGPSSELILGAGAASGTDITFGSLSVLGLDAPSSVHSTLVSLAPSDTIDLIGIGASAATIAGGDLIITLAAGGTLSYALASPNALDRAAVHTDGSGGADVVFYRQATAGTIAPATVNFGEKHAGSTLTQTYKIANTASVNPYSENLDGAMGAHSAGITDSGSFTGLAPGATNSTSLMASLVTSSGGVISGTATVNLESDGSGVSGDGDGTLALPPETVTLTGTIFNYATASTAAPNPINFGEHHVGAAVSQKLTLANAAVAGSYSENLDAKFSGTSSDLTVGGSVTELVAGATNSGGLSVSLHTGTAGVQTGAATLGLTSDGKNIDTLGTTALAAQTITVSGTLYNYATASAVAPNPIAFGEQHVGATLSQKLNLANTAAAGAYSENLDAKFSGTSSDLTGSGSVSELVAGATNSGGLSIGLHSATAGAFTGTGTIGLTSDGSTIDTLGTTALKAETVTVSGTLFAYATATVTPKPVSFGQHHVGDTLSQMLTISNGAVAGGFSENLDISFSGSSSDLTTSGAISELAAGSSNNSALDLILASGTAGSHSGTATLAAVSDGSTIDTLGTTVLASQTVSVSSTLFNYATASTASPNPINFGIVHVGATIGHFITLANHAATGVYSENLDAGFSGTTGDFSTTGAISELLAGKSSTAALDVVLQTGTAGTFAGSTTLALTSDGKNIDTLGTTALASQTVALTGTVNNYATAAIEALSGPGTLTGGGNTYALNLGSVAKGSAAIVENIGILNSATGPADNLSGTFSVSGATEIGHTGFTTFSGEAAGQADTSPMLTLSTGTVGTFTETIIVEAKGGNASGYSGTLAHETLVVTGTVTAAPEFKSAVAAVPVAPVAGRAGRRGYGFDAVRVGGQRNREPGSDERRRATDGPGRGGKIAGSGFISRAADDEPVVPRRVRAGRQGCLGQRIGAGTPRRRTGDPLRGACGAGHRWPGPAQGAALVRRRRKPPDGQDRVERQSAAEAKACLRSPSVM